METTHFLIASNDIKYLGVTLSKWLTYMIKTTNSWRVWRSYQKMESSPMFMDQRDWVKMAKTNLEIDLMQSLPKFQHNSLQTLKEQF